MKKSNDPSIELLRSAVCYILGLQDLIRRRYDKDFQLPYRYRYFLPRAERAIKAADDLSEG